MICLWWGGNLSWIPLLCKNYKKELEDFIRNVNIQKETEKFKEEVLLKEANDFNSIFVSYGSDCYRLGMQNIIEQCKKYLTNV